MNSVSFSSDIPPFLRGEAKSFRVVFEFVANFEFVQKFAGMKIYETQKINAIKNYREEIKKLELVENAYRVTIIYERVVKRRLPDVKKRVEALFNISKGVYKDWYFSMRMSIAQFENVRNSF